MVQSPSRKTLQAALFSMKDDDTQYSLDRRRTLNLLATVIPSILFFSSNPALANDDVFTKKTNQFAYQFQPPLNFEAGKKPLQTHLDEVNFKSKSQSGYQFGITVDPVRINSLRQFGTPEEVAAKVVLAEVNRDGVTDVTLIQDPYEGPDFYQLNYKSQGKRGIKRYVAKFYISKQMLYALTAQCKEDDYSNLEKEMLQAVDSFQVL